MLKTIDLFAGAGGLSLGFQMTGRFQLLAAAEINKNAQATYKANIVKDNTDFVFIDDVIGYDFAGLNAKLGGIDVIIGGPPCQGFSNANRQKNHIISMNNGLVKEYFRAIKQIQPKAFVMENVSMLHSDTHRFYESTRDNEEIDALVEKGFHIPKRTDTLFITKDIYEGLDLHHPEEIDLAAITLPDKLAQLLSVLNKNLNNARRLPKYLQKHSEEIVKAIDAYTIDSPVAYECTAQDAIISKLASVKSALVQDMAQGCKDDLEYVVGLQKVVSTIIEIKQNGLIGEYKYTDENELVFTVNSYSVIDYVNAILGDDYIQAGNTVNAEWFGVPQERRRYIIIGIRKDLFKGDTLSTPTAPADCIVNTVADALDDLTSYDVGYEPSFTPIPYKDTDNISAYAAKMRCGSQTVKNHITTKTTDIALERFKAIQPGKNFHSLGTELKSTYAKPERTQNTIYQRLDPNKPCGTVVNVRKSMWIHPFLDRAITVREAARLQSFPDSFEFTGPKDSQYQQVGNAVPPLLAKAIADKVLEYIE